jgi:hypothetical protein
VRHRLGLPSSGAEVGFSVTDVILAKLTHRPAVMIDRPPPPAAPKSESRLMIGRATRSGWSDNESADVERAHPRYAARELDSNVEV